MTVRLLLDTELALWALADPSRFSPATRKRLEESELYLSCASLWEVAVKSELGKMYVSAHEVLHAAAPAGFSLLPITAEHVIKVFELPVIHHDPIDRMLVAQAYTEPMYLLTNDAVLRAYGPMINFVGS